MIAMDELGPEAVVFVNDVETGMRGVLVIDNSSLGPCGGGTRMLPDLSVDEVAALARGMTYKFGILGMPRGGSKAGIWGDSSIPTDRKRAIMRAFGRRLRPYLETKDVAVGPDMGVTVSDVASIYEGAGVENIRSGLFEHVHEGDPAAYHITGYGVVVSMVAAAPFAGIDIRGSRVAIEGFGQVGVGVARYAERAGAKVVAISTVRGAIYSEAGLDVAALLRLRRECGDDCVLRYGRAEQLATSELYYLPVDALVPGARPYVINDENAHRVQAKLVVSAGNITTTEPAESLLFQRGVVSVPDFVANSGGAIASWVDFLSGDLEQAFAAIRRLIGTITGEVLTQARSRAITPWAAATSRVRERVIAARDQPRKTFEQTRSEIRSLLGM